MSGSAAPLAHLLDAAASAAGAVHEGRSLADALARVPADRRPGAQALAFQALRQWGAALVLRPLLAPRAPPPRLEPLLLTALALLWPGPAQADYADHTLVDQAVVAARRRLPAAAGFVNAVLRRFLREREAWVARALADPLARWQHPPWWIDRVRADWPDTWAERLHAANQPGPMVLRVNRRRASRDEALARLAAAGHPARAVEGAGLEQALVLDRPAPVDRLPGFSEGWLSVQDTAAQLAAPLLAGSVGGLVPLPPGARVLDACAAPGGKTTHLLELQDLALTALDADAQRLARVGQTLQRLGLEATLHCADAADLPAWWDGRPFDAILLDAPCTGSGIVRRHPDVRWLRRPGDIAALAATQARLLDALWPLLKPGGRLLYATCSIFRDEGERQIDAFLQRTAAGQPRRVPGSPGHLSGLADNSAHQSARPSGDGFFYALMSSG